MLTRKGCQAEGQVGLNRLLWPENFKVMSGGFGGGDDVVAGATRGGARPQTAEIIKTFRERCPDLETTMEKEKADYFVILDHEGGKHWLRKDNKVVVFDRAGTSVFSGSTRSLGNAVQDACEKIRELEPAS